MQKFCNGGMKLGYLKKEGVHQQAPSGGALEENVSLEILRGGLVSLHT